MADINLPPGFRFYPTDEELVVHFLHRKVTLLPCHPDVIPDLDLYPYDPWELDGKAMVEGDKWFYYSRRTNKRITGNGYWKPLGVDEQIFSTANKLVGLKKYYVFYMGKPPSGSKTNWVMQEYKLPDSIGSTSSSASRSTSRRPKFKADFTKWVICRVHEHADDGHEEEAELSYLDEVFLSLDDLDEISFPK
ncbi:NAC domain-containing protein 104-like [Impatiens glandulifera]|uniref:NAC domain-containing protein 104-like n=1 Tax=Impatiens glandulifera TaxID=253017 RepID=UPI001FB13DE6|nr:NAC domain-containing protein 104-like [Impatiens glandulifera]